MRWNRMREIKFRGKRIDNGKWVYGYFLVNQFGEHTICDKTFAAAVIPETVGQFAGLHDRGSKDIFEGDIIRYDNFYSDSPEDDAFIITEVKFVSCAFCVLDEGNWEAFTKIISSDDTEIIGNIYENPTLLEVVK